MRRPILHFTFPRASPSSLIFITFVSWFQVHFASNINVREFVTDSFISETLFGRFYLSRIHQ